MRVIVATIVAFLFSKLSFANRPSNLTLLWEKFVMWFDFLNLDNIGGGEGACSMSFA